MPGKLSTERSSRKKLAVLRTLREANKPVTSAEITRKLASEGYEVSERTVRLYLQALQEQGLVERVGRGLRRITRRGEEELQQAPAFEKVGFLAARIDQMTYRMSFSLEKRTGTVVANLTFIRPDDLRGALPHICKVFEKGYAMGCLAGIFGPGELVAENIVPQGHCAVATVCSVTLNGVLLDHGIPSHSRFGGLLEVVDGKPRRFVEIITYNGTSLDPLEIFIRSGMTDYRGAVATGTGRIGVGFREFPAESREHVSVLAEQLRRVGLGGFMALGWPGRPLVDVPVSEGRFGAIVIGGLNPAAILEELGIRVQSRALAGLLPYEQLVPYHELEAQAGRLGLL